MGCYRRIQGKGKGNHQILPRKIKVDIKNIIDKELIAKQFNTNLAEIGPKIAKKIQISFRVTPIFKADNVTG